MITTTGAALPDPKTEPVLTVARVGQILAVSPRHAYMLCERGDLPVIRLGKKSIRIPTAQFLAHYGLTDPTPE
jgi:hypothetical protein